MTSQKDALLKAILQVEKKLEEEKEQFKELKSSVSEAEKLKDQMKIALEEIERQYKEAYKNFSVKQDELSNSYRQAKNNQRELESLRRELSRLLDTEKINEEYLAQVEAFRQRCLEAPWRKENREDGRGAMPHQIEGAIHLAVAKQALLGDKRGLGKTLTSLVWGDYVEARKVIAISPADTMDNYIREIKLWAPHRSPIKLGKMDKVARQFVLPHLKQIPEFTLVMNYEIWRRDDSLIQDLIDLQADTLILDEAHRTKTWSTSTCKGVQKLRFGLNKCPECDNPKPSRFKEYGQYTDQVCCFNCNYVGFITEFCSIENVLPMTGTPILNKPQELFPQLRILDPKNWKTEKDFLKDFCTQTYERRWTWKYGAEKELLKKIGPRFLARDRKAAGVIIPPAEPVLHKISKDEMQESFPKQFEAYEQVRKYAQLVLDPDKELVMSMPIFIAVLTRLRQVITWPAGIELKLPNPDTGEKETFAHLNVFESIKLDKAEEIIREVVEEGERVVLFSQFKHPLHELNDRLRSKSHVKSCVYDGSTSTHLRNQIQQDFDVKTMPDKPRWDVVLGNYKAMGEGLNLNGASQMIILDEEWNPGRQEQAYGRIDRLGQTKDTMIHTLRVEGTVDVWMAALIEEKAELIGGFESEANLVQNMYDALRNGDL